MAADILERDADLHFPQVIVLKASAGSGKTHTLTKRFVQFILSEKIPKNKLRNILAVTFSNNAAKEMRERVLLWLKAVYLKDPGKISELSMIISLDKEQLIKKAGQLIDEILNNYSDFQVKTIDSFMTSVFKASALDFGYSPDFDILLSNDSLMEYSFNLFLRNVREGSNEAVYLEDVIDLVLERRKTDASYLWDPSSTLLEETKKIYRKLASTGKRPLIEDHAQVMDNLKARITEKVEAIEALIETGISKAGLKRHGNSSYSAILTCVRAGNFSALAGKGSGNPPITKKGSEQAAYSEIIDLWQETGGLIDEYTMLIALTHYTPYLRTYEAFREIIEAAKRHQGKIFIEDINKNLAEHLNSAIIPDVYFRIGDIIFHFLIDEFQDTAPIQWKNLLPLLENSLSQGGSAFAVGDTKQAIYGFRNADYTIMKNLETENPFPSAQHSVRELAMNYRSCGEILRFNEKVFREIAAQNDNYRNAAAKSGLTDYVQGADDTKKDLGYAEVALLDRNDAEPPEKQKLQDLIEQLKARGYRYGDIAVLTQRNEDVVRTTVWLNEKNISFISYSSLDIRRRKITGELVALMNFLDSPTDNLSFATFILGSLFTKTAAQRNPAADLERLRTFCFANKDNPPLYKAFQSEFPGLWEEFFAALFKAAGYFPLYDLVTEIFNIFRIFELAPEEEAALVKILEVVKDFEEEGYNNLKDFLEIAGDEDSREKKWDMNVPKAADAVKVLTVHKAKGLEFPVVIVLLYENKNRGFDYIVQEDEDKGEVRLLKITKEMSCSDSLLGDLYNKNRLSELVNKLNTLYVAFTRPKEELYVLGIKGRSAGYPFDLLPADAYPPSERTDKVSAAGPKAVPGFPLRHLYKHIQFQADTNRLTSAAERQRGEFMHKVLSLVEYADEGFDERLGLIIAKVKEETGAEYPDREILEGISAFIKNSGLSGYFKPQEGREIKNEQEFSDETGRLFRMDRLIIDRDTITVIDFKTGTDKGAEDKTPDKYKAQMKIYMRLLSDLYPDKAIEGILAYVDLKTMERII